MNDERIDLSALDPARDSERWERRIREVVAGAMLARRWTVSGQLSSWARPALALAAAAALFSWVGLVIYAVPLEGSAARTAAAAQQDRSLTLSSWAATDEQPSAGSLLSVLGGE
jgi:hypothetical protein